MEIPEDEWYIVIMAYKFEPQRVHCSGKEENTMSVNITLYVGSLDDIKLAGNYYSRCMSKIANVLCSSIFTWPSRCWFSAPGGPFFPGSANFVPHPENKKLLG